VRPNGHLRGEGPRAGGSGARALALLVPLLLAPGAALGQARGNDAAIPYDEEVPAPAPAGQKPPPPRPSGPALAHLDDPSVGLSAEFLAGAMLFSSSRGGLVDPRFMAGARLTWEFGRVIPDEVLRELFFVDLTWQQAVTSDGTTAVHAEAVRHDFTLAPAVGLPLGQAPVLAYLQAGAGATYDRSALTVNGVTTQAEGLRVLVQYGVGLRFRPGIFHLGPRELVRLSFRVEVTRFVRGYLQDTFLGGSLGLTF